jgi:DNA-binding LytR/AlgR family response regulator
MEEITGIRFLKVLKDHPYIIFTTAYENYAIQSYELEVVDYLLKPFLFDRFISAVDKVQKRILAESKGLKNKDSGKRIENHDFFFVKTGYHHQKIFFSDILYIEGQADYLNLVTRNRKIMTLQSFRGILELLPADEFVRVHKSYMVAVRHIDSIERNRIRIGDKIIPVSDTFSKDFYNLLKTKGLVN